MEKALFSSASAEWETPDVVYNYLNSIYHFNLDPCSTKENHKCENYFTKETDGLRQKWYPYKNIFMNPVYGNAESPCKPNCNKKKCITRGYHIDEFVPGIEDWVCHAFLQAKCGSLVCCLIPARTDTAWFQQYCMVATEIWLISGRLSFVNRTLPSWRSDGCFKASPAPFPSAIVIFDGLNQDLPAKPILKSMKINKKTNEIIVE